MPIFTNFLNVNMTGITIHFASGILAGIVIGTAIVTLSTVAAIVPRIPVSPAYP